MDLNISKTTIVINKQVIETQKIKNVFVKKLTPTFRTDTIYIILSGCQTFV